MIHTGEYRANKQHYEKNLYIKLIQATPSEHIWDPETKTTKYNN
jgi:hypothetical protein